MTKFRDVKRIRRNRHFYGGIVSGKVADRMVRRLTGIKVKNLKKMAYVLLTLDRQDRFISIQSLMAIRDYTLSDRDVAIFDGSW